MELHSPFSARSRRITRASYRRRRASHPAERRYDHPDIALYVDEAVTRQIVDDLAEEVREMRDRMMGFLFVIAGSVLLDVLTRMRGG